MVAVPLVPSVVTANGSLLVRPSIASVTVNCPVIAPASSSPVPATSPPNVAASFVVLTVISISLVSVFPSSSVIVTVNLSVPL